MRRVLQGYMTCKRWSQAPNSAGLKKLLLRAYQHGFLAARQQELAVQGEAEGPHSMRVPVHSRAHHVVGCLPHLCLASPA